MLSLEEDKGVPVHDCGYRGEQVLVGIYYPSIRTFVKKVDAIKHFMRFYPPGGGGWGFSVSVLERLRHLGCETLKLIVSQGAGPDKIEWVESCLLEHYFNDKVYVTRADRIDDNKRSDVRDRDKNLYSDVQRFVSKDVWRRL